MTNNSLPPTTTSLSRARWLLLIAAVLFAAWIGWLAYLAFTTTRPIVLSRPQFLAAQVDVIARVEEKAGRPDPVVKDVVVSWARDQAGRPLEGQTLTIANLAQVTEKEGWLGPETYILPLIKEDNTYALAPI